MPTPITSPGKGQGPEGTSLTALSSEGSSKDSPTPTGQASAANAQTNQAAPSKPRPKAKGAKAPLSGEGREPKVLHFLAHWFGTAQFDRTLGSDDAPLALHHNFAHRSRGAHAKARDKAREAAREAKNEPKALAGNAQHEAPSEVDPASARRLSKGSTGSQSLSMQIFEVLDKDGDGDVDFEDIKANLASEVEGEAEEDLISQHWPWYMIIQNLAAIVLWLVFAIKDQSTDFNSFLWAEAGLESIFPGRTGLLVHRDCQDLRWEAWRWWSYQYTHGSLSHVGMNVFLNLVAGLQLEGFQGSVRTILIFNLGVFAGACAHMVYNPHAGQLVGMSAGCYSLMGMHMADLLLNWSKTRFRKPKLAVLILLLGIDIVNIHLSHASGAEAVAGVASHAAHIGGYAAGLLMGVCLGRNMVVDRFERVLQALALLCGAGLIAFCVAWFAQWPPRSLVDTTPWCWARQVFNNTRFGDNLYHCVRCGTQDCIDQWSKQRFIHQVNWNVCQNVHGWSFSG